MADKVKRPTSEHYCQEFYYKMHYYYYVFIV